MIQMDTRNTPHQYLIISKKHIVIGSGSSPVCQKLNTCNPLSPQEDSTIPPRGEMIIHHLL
jgi:hypothetical protein